MKLWRYNFCPFYVSFAPYIVLSFILVSLMGCISEPKTDNEKAKDKLTDEYSMGCTNDITSSSAHITYRCENAEAICYRGSDAIFCFLKDKMSCKYPQ